MKTWLILIVGLWLGLGFAETRTVEVDISRLNQRAVPVSLNLLSLRNTVGAEFPMNWDSLRVMAGNREVPYQIDDTDLNGRLSAGDELAFLADGPVRIEISDMPAAAASYPAELRVSGGETTRISSLTGNGFAVEVPESGLVRIVSYGDTEGLLADELGILRFSGYPESTWWANETLGPHEEYTTLEAGGMRHVRTEVLPAGPARVTVVSEYASDRFAGLSQRVVARIYASGDVDVSNEVSFRGYADMMKMQSMATKVLSNEDPDTIHVLPAFRKLIWAEQLGTSAADYYAERDAVLKVGSNDYVNFRTDDNVNPLYWGAAYIFASAEPWRANFAPSLGLVLVETSAQVPEIPADNDSFLSGNTWVFESQEFRTGVFKWTADEFGTYAATQDVTPSTPNHYLPGDSLTFRHTYSLLEADSLRAAVRAVVNRRQALSSVQLESD